MNDAPTDPAQRDYRDTVFLPQTSFPMRGDLPKREPQILARWDADGPVVPPARRLARTAEIHPA